MASTFAEIRDLRFSPELASLALLGCSVCRVCCNNDRFDQPWTQSTLFAAKPPRFLSRHICWCDGVPIPFSAFSLGCRNLRRSDQTRVRSEFAVLPFQQADAGAFCEDGNDRFHAAES